MGRVVIVLDTNVLVYAIGQDHPEREPCRRIVTAVADGVLAATTTSQVIQEFLHVYARRRGRNEAAARANDWIDLLGPLVELDDETVREALAWYGDTDLDATDAFLAAVAHADPERRVVSADRDFAVLEERWVTPRDLAAELDG